MEEGQKYYRAVYSPNKSYFEIGVAPFAGSVKPSTLHRGVASVDVPSRVLTEPDATKLPVVQSDLYDLIEVESHDVSSNPKLNKKRNFGRHARHQQPKSKPQTIELSIQAQ